MKKCVIIGGYVAFGIKVAEVTVGDVTFLFLCFSDLGFRAGLCKVKRMLLIMKASKARRV